MFFAWITNPPYIYYLKLFCNNKTFGIKSGIFNGIAFPSTLILFSIIGFYLKIDMNYDKLAESFLGWVILILITLGPGILYPYISTKYFEKPNKEIG